MSSKSLPKRVRFFIADDIRIESQKPMVIGLLMDDFVGIDLPVGKPEPSAVTPIMLQSLAILASFIDCKGTFDAETSLYKPDGAALFEHQKLEGGVSSQLSDGKSNISFVAKFMPFVITEFGQYRFVFKLDAKEYEYKFRVGRAQLPKN
ncbi:MAG: hypothetical protein PHQ60_00580 [Sideroxydans sp.]|nr:hypothetical protein [Sideroxydans sp.]